MGEKVDLFDSTYSHFEVDVLARVRRKTFGEDFGQNSWTTAEEYRRWIPWLDLREDSVVLEVASGSGGPALFLAREVGCRVLVVDINPHGVATANESDGADSRVAFAEANADGPLPYSDEPSTRCCVDSANHFPQRLKCCGTGRSPPAIGKRYSRTCRCHRPVSNESSRSAARSDTSCSPRPA
jgi:SAM-dependent methyltransferase